MPYKDLEPKRQWEREHRQERNARRRKSMSNRSIEPAGVDAPLPDPNSAHVPLTGMNVVMSVMMGLASLLTVLIVMWRLRSSTDSAVST